MRKQLSRKRIVTCSVNQRSCEKTCYKITFSWGKVFKSGAVILIVIITNKLKFAETYTF